MLKDKLTELVRPVIEGLGYELWELEYSPRRGHGMVRLYIETGGDADAGISLQDCERVSRAVSDVLDAEDPVPGQYTLEVSSPGFDRPLSTPEHFAAYVGERVFVELKHPIGGRRRYSGLLHKAGSETIEVEVDGNDYALPISDIKKAHLAPED